MTDLAGEIRRRAASCCEYCRIPEAAFRRSFHVEHIIARQHGGQARLDNLALACWTCNLKKGPNLTGIDPESGVVTALFNPRQHHWKDHFMFAAATPDSIEIRGRSATGRTTVRVLGMNNALRNKIRYDLWRERSSVSEST